MNVDAGSITLGAALVAGLAGSGHCLGMCGGIAGALAMRGAAGPRQPTFGSKLLLALVYNVSRVASYAVAGALAGLLGRALLRAGDVAPLSIALRVVAGLVMIAAAGRLLFGWRLLDPLEAAGSRLWRRIAPGAGRGARRDGVAGAISLGLAWGWLPCGMTYSMLLLAATTASAGMGALVMAAFGLGTLPAMVSATVAFERAARLLSTKASLRAAAGLLLLVFGAWTGGNALYSGLTRGGGHAGHAGHVMPAPSAAPAAAGHEGHVMTPGMDMSGMDMAEHPAGHVMEPPADQATATDPDATSADPAR
ncbi:MAG: sulfite exporter TauE/SafE family protein [Gammaproteobacteria bacterium]|nr:sulfite exporter TauE/SafE family protein [Gammaproteobacteria bacterium]